MDAEGDFYTTQEAAVLLGVTTRRVQQMIDQGVLARVARGLVDATSIDRYRAAAHGGRTRVWGEHTAWAAVAVLSGVRPEWLGSTQLSRLRGVLRTTDVSGLIARTRARAVARTYQAHPAAARRLAEHLVVPDSRALGLVAEVTLRDLADSDSAFDGATGHLSGYYPSTRLDEAVTHFGLRANPTGNLTLRATEFDSALIRQLSMTSDPVLTALDAATALDPRERGLGLAALQATLDGYRG